MQIYCYCQVIGTVLLVLGWGWGWGWRVCNGQCAVCDLEERAEQEGMV
jgi:hypothetical protein